MSVEHYQLAIISKVAALQDINLLQELDSILLKKALETTQKKREPGFAKGFFTYVSDDFDDFIPQGFGQA